MITRAALCPSPPLLARDLTGRADVLPELRDACATAVTRLLAARPGLVTVVGVGDATRAWPPGSRLDLRAYAPGLRGEVPAGTRGLPLGLGLGTMLLDEAGYRGPRVLQAIAADAPARACLQQGADCADSAPRAGLLVMGDGSARRSPAAPGHLDERAAPFDAGVEQAIRDGDMTALAALDPRLASELMATGRAAWQVLAGALGTTTPGKGEILYSGVPFGVSYLVAVLDIAR
jgi:hypothetical protein